MLRRHWRFYGGLVAGAAVALLLPLSLMARLLAAADVLFAFYLATTFVVARRFGPDDLRRHAGTEDEGMPMLLLIALGAVVVSVAAIFDALHAQDATLASRLRALASVPLGWATLHTLFAFRYAHLWYSPGGPATKPEDPREGLDFGRATPEPGVADFLYFSFTIGMTAQTSDIEVTTTAMRRLALWHAVISFFYYTVLIALAVNAGLGPG